MNGYNESETPIDKSSYWKYSLNINVEDIVYVHCHQSGGEDTGGTIILVGQDGVQRSPIHFPEGGHMASFLNCLETGKFISVPPALQSVLFKWIHSLLFGTI